MLISNLSLRLSPNRTFVSNLAPNHCYAKPRECLDDVGPDTNPSSGSPELSLTHLFRL